MLELLTLNICSLFRVCVQISAKWRVTTATRQWSWTTAYWGSWRSCLRPKQSTCTRPWHCTPTLRCCPACKWSPMFTGCSAAHPCWGLWPCSSKNKVCLLVWTAPGPGQGAQHLVQLQFWSLVVEFVYWSISPLIQKTCWSYVGISETFFWQENLQFP